MTWEAAMRWALIWSKRDKIKYYVCAIPPYCGHWTYAVLSTKPLPLELSWPAQKPCRCEQTAGAACPRHGYDRRP